MLSGPMFLLIENQKLRNTSKDLNEENKKDEELFVNEVQEVDPTVVIVLAVLVFTVLCILN